MANATLQSSSALFSHWRTLRAGVEAQVQRVRCLIADLPAQDVAVASPNELLASVSSLVDLLSAHGQCEVETYDALKDELGCVEVDSAKRQAVADQTHLSSRLDLICQELRSSVSDLQVPSPAVIEKLDWFFDDLDQHLERECESIEWLSQHGCH